MCSEAPLFVQVFHNSPKNGLLTAVTYHPPPSLRQTLRAPSRHCGDAKVYGHTTTAMHDIEYTPPPPTLYTWYIYRLGWPWLATTL